MFDIRVVHLENPNSASGGKAYRLILVSHAASQSQPAILVTRFGKSSNVNQSQAKDFATFHDAYIELDQKIAEKTRKGYKVISDNTETGVAPLMKGRHLEPRDITAMKPVVHVLDGSSVVEPPISEEAKRNREANQRLEEAKAELARQQKAEEEKGYADNPIYGMFS